MKRRHFLHFLTTLSLLIGFLFIVGTTINIKLDDNVFYAELLYQVENEFEARSIESTYNVDLIQVSNYGIATYGVDNINTYETMEVDGFVQNSTYEADDITAELTRDPDFRYQYAIAMMEIEQAWLFTEGSSNVTIAIIDSGIDIYHEEFTGRLSPLSYNSKTEQVGLSYVIDNTGHGTSVAGVIGAIKNNSQGIAGLVENSPLIIIKANNDDNPDTEDDESKFFNETAIIEGIYYAVDHGADVINMSLGGTYANPLTEAAVEYAISQGVILVAASGNNGDDTLVYPASFEGVISVSAVDEGTNIVSYSSYGSEVDIAAPGHLIATTFVNNEYGYSSGTSLAAPQVTGVIALLISQYPDESSNQIMNRVYHGAVDYGTTGRDDYYGYGIINARLAMNVDQQIYIVNFETNGGTIIESIEVLSGQSINVTEPTKTGHTFEGWFRDEALTIPFIMGTDIIAANTTLYAKFELIEFTVAFVTKGSTCDDMQVLYGESFIPPTTTLEGFYFVGWYLDVNLLFPYNGNIVTSDMTLYARFAILYHHVTAYVEGEVFASFDTQDSRYVVIDEPHIDNQRFIGWYLDSDLTIPYDFDKLYDDLILYAKFDDQQVQVLFYDSDLTTIYQESYVFIGESATAPLLPNKPSSPSFDFTFIGWSETYDNVTQELDIYPVYEKTYKPESIYLFPGIDTVTEGVPWVDAGTSLIDDLLHIINRTEVNYESEGTYILYYDIYDGSTLIDTRVRVVHVIAEASNIEITLNPDVTTIVEGDTYEDQGAVTNIGTIVTTGTVDTETAGTYVITYTVFYNNQMVSKNKYVYVLPSIEESNAPEVYYKKEEDGVRL
ncbi:MAG: S8 family serine peptidase [Firmicutes bacterium]|nr:S8 family serine peptidase [Bacillota bacterium]